MSSIMRRRRGLKSAISILLSEGVGCNTTSSQAGGALRHLAAHAAVAASFNPRVSLFGKRSSCLCGSKGDSGKRQLSYRSMQGPCDLHDQKRTRNWRDARLAKLRGDQRSAKAELALLVSEPLPKGVESFELVDGVWITHSRFVHPVSPQGAAGSTKGRFRARRRSSARAGRNQPGLHFLADRSTKSL